MDTTVLFRIGSSLEERDEFTAALEYMKVETSRCVCKDTTVFGRYSVLPYYEDLEQDLNWMGSRLINSHEQHRWIANFDYYNELSEYTFQSWTERQFPYSTYEGPFVVKGMTNSKKHNWNSMMFAKDRREAVEVAIKLRQDELIGRQKLIYRKYTPLVTYEMGLNGLAFTNEWRFFFLGKKLIAHGYYWSEAEDVETPRLSEEGLVFAQEVANIASEHVNFFVLDIGEKQEGGWVLVEINDAQMAGLSLIDPHMFYRGLNEAARSFDFR